MDGGGVVGGRWPVESCQIVENGGLTTGYRLGNDQPLCMWTFKDQGSNWGGVGWGLNPLQNPSLLELRALYSGQFLN